MSKLNMRHDVSRARSIVAADSAEQLGEGLSTSQQVMMTQPKANGIEHVAQEEPTRTLMATPISQLPVTGMTAGTTTVVSRRWP